MITILEVHVSGNMLVAKLSVCSNACFTTVLGARGRSSSRGEDYSMSQLVLSGERGRSLLLYSQERYELLAAQRKLNKELALPL